MVPGFYGHLRPLGESKKFLLSDFEVDNEGKLPNMGADEFWGDPDYDYFEIHKYSPPFNKQDLISGYIIVPNLDACDLIHNTRKHLGASGFQDVEVTELARGAYFDWSRPGYPILEVMIRVLRRGCGQEPALYPSFGGGSGLHSLIKEIIGAPYLLMVPYGQPDMNEHWPHESLDIDWFINEKKVAASRCEEFEKSDIGRSSRE